RRGAAAATSAGFGPAQLPMRPRRFHSTRYLRAAALALGLEPGELALLLSEIEHHQSDHANEHDRGRRVGGEDIAKVGQAGATLRATASGAAARSSAARMRRR